MTPAVDQLVSAGVPHRAVTYEHTPGESYGAAAVAALGLELLDATVAPLAG